MNERFWEKKMFKSFQGICSIFFSLSETYELKRQQHLTELNKKEEDMRQAFVIRVKEKEAHLKETEKEVSYYITPPVFLFSC